MTKLKNEIWAYALRNIIEYGKTTPENVLPKLFQHGLDKKDIGKVMPEITKAVSEISALSPEKRIQEFEKFKDYIKEREEKEKTLPELPNVKGMVITRLPPEPSKYLHIGHAISFVLNYIYAKRYNGRCLLRFEDANPEKVSQEYVDAILDDIKNYLDIKFDDLRFVSDDLPLLYDYAEKLINKEKAYMCFCSREIMQDFRHKGKECECRKNKEDKNLKEWKNFLKGDYMKGEAILRIKGDMQSKNHVMRDSVIFRAVAEKHFRHGAKYKVWPMYDFYNPIEDSLMGVTHVLRSNEFEQRVELQDYIKEALGLKKQTIIQYGRFNVIDATTKGREIRELIESGELIGWDDPRLVTLRALKRRGIKKEVIYALVNEVGLSKYAVNLDFNMIAAISRKLLDKSTERYYFVKAPKKLSLSSGIKIKEVKIKIHPDKEEYRVVKVGKDIFISQEDFNNFKGKEVRLMNLFNVRLGEKSEILNSDNMKVQKIQWVSSGFKAKILMDDGKFIEGLVEDGIKRLKNSEIVQLERFGFVKLDKKEKEEYEFWFTHK